MDLRDKVLVRGGIVLEKHNRKEYIPNVVTTVGKHRLASHSANNASSNYWFSHLAFGVGTDIASTEDLSLSAEFYRAAFDYVFSNGPTVFGQIVLTGNMIDTYLGVDLGSGIYNIYEMGLLDAISGGNLICRQTLPEPWSITGEEELCVLWGVTML